MINLDFKSWFIVWDKNIFRRSKIKQKTCELISLTSDFMNSIINLRRILYFYFSIKMKKLTMILIQNFLIDSYNLMWIATHQLQNYLQRKWSKVSLFFICRIPTFWGRAGFNLKAASSWRRRCQVFSWSW